MTKRRMITQPVYANAYYDQSVAIEFHEMDIAVILANIEYWVTVNELHEKDWDNPVHLHDGKWWTFGSVEYYSKYFPHLTYKQVKVRLQKLEDAGYIVSGNYNKISLDRTKWYTLSDEYRQIRQAEIDAVNSEKNGKNTDSDSPKRVDMLTQTGQSSTTERLSQTGQAIPDNKPYPDNKQQTDSVMVNSSVSTQDAESTASDRELSAPSPFEAPNTKRTDEVNETPETNAPSSTSQSPAESENKLNNQEFAKKVYNRVQARLRRATATARKVGNTERMQYFADQLRLWRKPDKRATILSRIQWLLDADIYTQGQIENVLMDTVNGYYMRKEVNDSGDEVEVSVPNDLVRVLTQSDQDQMLWQLDKNFKITDDVIDELLEGGEDDEEGTYPTN